MHVPESPSLKGIEETERSNVGTGRLKQKDQLSPDQTQSEDASSILQGYMNSDSLPEI